MVTKSLFAKFGKWTKEKTHPFSLSLRFLPLFPVGVFPSGDLTADSSWLGHPQHLRFYPEIVSPVSPASWLGDELQVQSQGKPGVRNPCFGIL